MLAEKVIQSVEHERVIIGDDHPDRFGRLLSRCVGHSGTLTQSCAYGSFAGWALPASCNVRPEWLHTLLAKPDLVQTERHETRRSILHRAYMRRMSSAGPFMLQLAARATAAATSAVPSGIESMRPAAPKK